MKLVSGRMYKNDMSDIVGILYECKKNNKPITYEMIDKAVNDLYGNWNLISNEIKEILDSALKNDKLEKLYNEVSNNEQARKSSLLEFDNKYPEVLNESNINDILKKLK